MFTPFREHLGEQDYIRLSARVYAATGRVEVHGVIERFPFRKKLNGKRGWYVPFSLLNGGSS